MAGDLGQAVAAYERVAQQAQTSPEVTRARRAINSIRRQLSGPQSAATRPTKGAARRAMGQGT